MKPNQTKPNPTYLIYMYKEDLALNNQQWLICHKPNPTKPNHIYLIYMYKEDLALNNLQWLICYKTQLKIVCNNDTIQHGSHNYPHPAWKKRN